MNNSKDVDMKSWMNFALNACFGKNASSPRQKY